jgi:hypothetical protein
MEIEKHQKYKGQLDGLADIVGIKLAPLEQMLAVYPDQFMGMEFREERDHGATNARVKYSLKMQQQLITAFHSHQWKVYSDIYGHNGLSSGGSCQKCGRKFKFPLGEYTDDFILAYHYVYGQHQRFGGRITKCKGHK